MASLKHELCLISQKYPSFLAESESLGWYDLGRRLLGFLHWLCLRAVTDFLPKCHILLFLPLFLAAKQKVEPVSFRQRNGQSQHCFDTWNTILASIVWSIGSLQLRGARSCWPKNNQLTGSHENGWSKRKIFRKDNWQCKVHPWGSHWTEIRCWERPPPSWGPRRDQLANSELWSSRAFPLRLEPVRPITHLLVLLPPQQGIP